MSLQSVAYRLADYCFIQFRRLPDILDVSRNKAVIVVNFLFYSYFALKKNKISKGEVA